MTPRESKQEGDHRGSSPGSDVTNPRPREQTAFGRRRCSPEDSASESRLAYGKAQPGTHMTSGSQGYELRGRRPLSPPRPDGGAGPTRGRILRKHISRLCSILPAFHRNSDRKATVIYSLQKTIVQKGDAPTSKESFRQID